MKKILFIALVLAGCQKEVVKPGLPKLSTKNFDVDSLFHAKFTTSFTQTPISYVSIQMYIDGSHIDGTVIEFDPASLAIYQKLNPVADAIYLFSWESLANFTSLSADPKPIPLAINRRPYKSNDTIPLRIYARCGGNYRFKVSSNIAYKMCIMDNGWKCNLDNGFTVDLADSTTFYNRFKLIVK